MTVSPNDAQSKVIETTEGPLLVVAGPGSGKTFCLIERVVNILQLGDIHPERILISTFTKKAAKELVTRISSRLGGVRSIDNPLDLTVGTLHSIFLKLLEEFRAHTRIQKNYTILDQFDQQYFIFQQIREFREIDGIEEAIGITGSQSSWRFAGSLAAWLNKISEEGVSGEAMVQNAAPKMVALGQAYLVYQRLLSEFNYLDFSTIQVEMLRLLDNPDVCEDIQNRFDYLMIDEYQDTNTIQEKIILKLSEKHRNLCVVGDDDQALYRFRGASIRNILEFPQRFNAGECSQVRLTQNYRSKSPIIDFYNQWMEATDWEADGTSFRFDKTIQAANHAKPGYPTVFKVSGEDGADNWAEETLAFLKNLRASGTIKDWNQVAFLFRSVRNPKVVAFANDLEAAGIPIYAPRSNMFFERIEIRLMIGAILFMFPQYGSIRQTREGMTFKVWAFYDDCLGGFIAHLKGGTDPQITAWTAGMAKQHLGLTDNTNYAFSSLFYDLIQFPTFSEFLDEGVAHAGVRDSRPARNLSKFSRLLNKFEYLYNVIVIRPDHLERDILMLFNYFMRFLWDGGIEEYEDDSEYAPSGCVSFMTVHQSKGLEFPIVIVGSLDAVPRKQYSDMEVMLEQEFGGREPFEPQDRIKTFDFWRLFYTAFSRAQSMLVLTCQENVPKGRGQRNVPSAYFCPVYDQLKSWSDLTFEPANIDLAEVKEVDIKQSYSFTSDVLVFEGCPQQYRLFKDLEFAPVRTNAILFGTLVHQTIEDIHKAVLRGDESKVTVEQITSWFDVNYANLTKKERVYLAEPVLNTAKRHVTSYVEREQQHWHRLRDAEVELSLLKDDYILTGTVDLVQADDGSYEIIDFKSEKKPDLIDEADRLNRYRRQLQIYAHLLEEKRDIDVSRMTLYYTGEEAGNPRITFNRENTDVEGTIAKIDSVIHNIVEKNYGISERPERLCKNCDFQAFCDMTFCKT